LFRSIDVRQLIMYSMLNYVSKGRGIERLGLFNPRIGVSATTGGSTNIVSSPIRKNISLPALVETPLLIPSSRPTKGRIAIVTDVRRDAVDAAAFCARKVAGQASRLVSDHKASGRETMLRTAKSCGPDAPTLASSLRSCVGPTGLRQNHIRRRRWQKSPVTGESAK